jgi:HrpA-like RNA helicase
MIAEARSLHQVWNERATYVVEVPRHVRLRDSFCRLNSLMFFGSPLESVVLLVKGLEEQRLAAGSAVARSGSGGGKAPTRKPVAFVLRQCLSPPDPSAVIAAVELLRAIGALEVFKRDGEFLEREGPGAAGAPEALTPLGRHLNAMPMDPRCVGLGGRGAG